MEVAQRMGPYYLAMGLEDTPGVPAPPERMETISSSQFGSSFLVPVKLHDRRNFTVKTFRKNWQPPNMIFGLNFISMSIANVLSFIKILHNESLDKAPFTYPTDFDKTLRSRGASTVGWWQVSGGSHRGKRYYATQRGRDNQVLTRTPKQNRFVKKSSTSGISWVYEPSFARDINRIILDPNRSRSFRSYLQIG